MTYTYKKIAELDDSGNKTGDCTNQILRTDDQGGKTFVPFDNGNVDYQEYLAWVAEGNTAEASD